MKKLLAILLFCSVTVSLVRAQVNNFPAAYTGTWQGKLNIHSPGVKQKGTVDMVLKIQPTDSQNIWQWEINYITDGKAPDVRKYLLVINDSTKGKYCIDEQSGIVINARLIANVLTTRFKVNGSLLLINYRFEENEIVFEVFSGPAERTTETGNNPEQNIPPVTVFDVGNYQKAVLVKPSR
jgi:hypothetical protein